MPKAKRSRKAKGRKGGQIKKQPVETPASPDRTAIEAQLAVDQPTNSNLPATLSVPAASNDIASDQQLINNPNSFTSEIARNMTDVAEDYEEIATQCSTAEFDENIWHLETFEEAQNRVICQSQLGPDTIAFGLPDGISEELSDTQLAANPGSFRGVNTYNTANDAEEYMSTTTPRATAGIKESTIGHFDDGNEAESGIRHQSQLRRQYIAFELPDTRDEDLPGTQLVASGDSPADETTLNMSNVAQVQTVDKHTTTRSNTSGEAASLMRHQSQLGRKYITFELPDTTNDELPATQLVAYSGEATNNTTNVTETNVEITTHRTTVEILGNNAAHTNVGGEPESRMWSQAQPGREDDIFNLPNNSDENLPNTQIIQSGAASEKSLGEDIVENNIQLTADSAVVPEFNLLDALEEDLPSTQLIPSDDSSTEAGPIVSDSFVAATPEYEPAHGIFDHLQSERRVHFDDPECGEDQDQSEQLATASDRFFGDQIPNQGNIVSRNEHSLNADDTGSMAGVSRIVGTSIAGSDLETTRTVVPASRQENSSHSWASGSLTTSMREMIGLPPKELRNGRKRRAPEPDPSPPPPRWPCVTTNSHYTCGHAYQSVVHSHLCAEDDYLGPVQNTASPAAISLNESGLAHSGQRFAREVCLESTSTVRMKRTECRRCLGVSGTPQLANTAEWVNTGRKRVRICRSLC